MPVTADSINQGKNLFMTVGCAFCHVPFMPTGNHATPALANQTANLFSDLLVHDMGVLGDGIAQAAAGPREFVPLRFGGLASGFTSFTTAPLPTLSMRSRSTPLTAWIGSSEAFQVIVNYNGRTAAEKQHILNFLRSL